MTLQLKAIYGEGPDKGLRVRSLSETAIRFELEAIRKGPAEYGGIGAALALLEIPEGDVKLRVHWARLEVYCDPAEDWQNLWFQFGALPGRQHPVFYVRPSPAGYEVGWNTGPAKEQQIILGDVFGRPLTVPRGLPQGEYADELREYELLRGECYFGIRPDAFSIGDAGGYVGTFRLPAVSQYGEIGRKWLGLYCEASKVDVLVEIERGGV